MAKFNDLISAEKKPISDLNASFSSGEIYVDNTFQRKSVWVLRNKIRLIETILRGYPMPEIYLWEGQPNPKSGATKQSVVDGQQRLTAIREFIAGTFALQRKSLDAEPVNPPYQDKSFADLETDDKKSLWAYKVTIRSISAEVSKPEIVKIFLRLNETDKSLNPQELRHAEFNGLFIETVETIADLKFWATYKIFNLAVVRRMGDLQFISSLLMFLRSGIEEEVDQESINKMYDSYNESYPTRKADIRTAKEIIRVIEGLFKGSADVAKFFRSPVHFYALFIVIYQQRALKKAINTSRWVKRLLAFGTEYKKKKPSGVVARYKAAATEGTQKRQNREDRVRYLKEWVLAS